MMQFRLYILHLPTFQSEEDLPIFYFIYQCSLGIIINIIVIWKFFFFLRVVLIPGIIPGTVGGVDVEEENNHKQEEEEEEEEG